jgi:uncharacterized ion transporter superfamily protein YfcC
MRIFHSNSILINNPKVNRTYVALISPPCYFVPIYRHGGSAVCEPPALPVLYVQCGEYVNERKVRVPNTLIIIFFVALAATVLTWIVPGGAFDYVEKDGREVAVPGSFEYIERNPQGIGSLLTAPARGINEVSYIIGFVLIIGGIFAIIQKTGAIAAAIHTLAAAHTRSPAMRRLTIPATMFVFSLAGATFGMSEEVIPFVLIFIPLARRLGYDSITGVAMCYVAAHVGFAGAFMNPFTVGIAHGIAELPVFSGLEYRLAVWFILTLAAVLMIVRYARKVKDDPHASPVRNLDMEKWPVEAYNNRAHPAMTLRQKLILAVLGLTIGGLVAGVLRYEWYVTEIAGLFLGTGILCGIIGGLKLNQFAESFIKGAGELVGPALMIGFARGILIITQDGRIIDTILHWMSTLISAPHPVVSAWMMFLTQSCVNFFVPSGSGQAALTMPIMAPLSDLVGITRQTAVLAFQMGDGFTNMIVPTAPVLMGVLGLSKIPWNVWARWILPYQAVLFLLGCLLLIPPVLFGWGPF